jgi:hypothetical protein
MLDGPRGPESAGSKSAGGILRSPDGRIAAFAGAGAASLGRSRGVDSGSSDSGSDIAASALGDPADLVGGSLSDIETRTGQIFDLVDRSRELAATRSGRGRAAGMRCSPAGTYMTAVPRSRPAGMRSSPAGACMTAVARPRPTGMRSSRAGIRMAAVLSCSAVMRGAVTA